MTLQSIMMTPFFNMMIKLSLGVERLFDFQFLTRLLVGCLLLPPFCHVICRGLLRIHLFTMLFLLLASILVPKRFKWVCREALYSLVTPGHLLYPDLFLNCRHIIEYILFIQNTAATQGDHLSSPWINTQPRK